MHGIEWRHLGLLAYRDAFELQRARWERVVARAEDEVIYTLEHRAVVTLGRRGRLEDLHTSRADLEARGIDVVETDRGGELTYHGPGQLVIYPILAVGRRRIAPGDLVRMLASAVVAELASLGAQGSYDTKRPGIWVGDAKICAVGMRISRGVSTHGAALNVTTALDAFELFTPCGMPDSKPASLLSLGLDPPPLETLARSIVERFADALGPLPVSSTETS